MISGLPDELVNILMGIVEDSPNAFFLIVEGQSDKDFYDDLLNEYFEYKNMYKRYSHKTFICPVSDIDIDKSVWNEINPFFNRDIGKAFYVNIKCVNHLISNGYNKVFGFIDHDFGHDDIIGSKSMNPSCKNHIAYTEGHDFEVSLIRSYFPQIFGCTRDEKRTLKLIKVFYDCYEQGILQKSSFDFEKMYQQKHGTKMCDELLKSLIRITSWYFGDYEKYPSFNLTGTIEDYLMEHQKDTCIKDIYDEFMEIYKLNYEKNHIEAKSKKDETSISSLLDEWSKNGIADDKTMLNVLYLINGHYLINQLISGGDLFAFKNEKHFREYVLNTIIGEKGSFAIARHNPIKQYLRFMDENM